MSKNQVLSLRLDEETLKTLKEEAANQRRPLSYILREMLTEAIKVRKCPGIAFLDGPTGRRAVIAGTGMDVWEVISTYKNECRENFEELKRVYHWLTPVQLKSALNYYHLYPREIEERIKKNEELTEESAKENYPHLFPLKV